MRLEYKTAPTELQL